MSVATVRKLPHGMTDEGGRSASSAAFNAGPLDAVRGKAGARRIALFGGTFDPVHAGHLAVACAAQKRFQFDRMFFIPAGRPPHKTDNELSPYVHRFAMTALACADHAGFVPSLAEAGPDGLGGRIYYSVDTVRRFRKEAIRNGDRLYFLLGADSFLQLRTWKNYDALLELCDFVVASRPGFRGDALRDVIPAKLLGPVDETATSSRRAEPMRSRKNSGLRVVSSIALRRTVVYMLPVTSHVSATQVRERLNRGRSIRGLVPALVEEYITKQALYT